MSDLLGGLKEGLEKNLKSGIDKSTLDKIQNLLKTMDLNSALKTLKIPEDQWKKIEALLKK